MVMPTEPHQPRVTLSLPPEEHWTLHHVLLDRIERESTAEHPTRVDPPPVEVFQAFETLDAGETSFTIAQLEAIQTILTEYLCSTSLEDRERSRLEQLLHYVAERIEQYHAALPID